VNAILDEELRRRNLRRKEEKVGTNLTFNRKKRPVGKEPIFSQKIKLKVNYI